LKGAAGLCAASTPWGRGPLGLSNPMAFLPENALIAQISMGWWFGRTKNHVSTLKNSRF